MRKIMGSLLLAVLMLPLVSATDAVAQEEEGGYALVLTISMSPADRAAYRSALGDLATAAAANEVTVPWWAWSHDSGYTVVLGIENMAWFDRDGAFWGQFDEGSQAAFRTVMAGIDREVTSEVTRGAPAWSYAPADEIDEMGVAHVHHDWLKGGQEEAYNEISKDWVAFLEMIDYPYAVECMRTVVGSQKITCVTFADDLSRFTSDETWDDLIEAAEAREDFQGLLERWRETVIRWEHWNASFVKSMSYWPGKTD